MIRKYENGDLDELLDVWYDASRIAHPFLTTEFLEQEKENIPTKHLPVAETWVYEDEGSVVGFIALIKNEVGAIFVTPRRHGTGVGRALMDHAKTSREFLEVDVFEANEIGRRFYDAYGFKFLKNGVHEQTGNKLIRMRLD